MLSFLHGKPWGVRRDFAALEQRRLAPSAWARVPSNSWICRTAELGVCDVPVNAFLCGVGMETPPPLKELDEGDYCERNLRCHFQKCRLHPHAPTRAATSGASTTGASTRAASTAASTRATSTGASTTTGRLRSCSNRRSGRTAAKIEADHTDKDSRQRRENLFCEVFSVLIGLYEVCCVIKLSFTVGFGLN